MTLVLVDNVSKAILAVFQPSDSGEIPYGVNAQIVSIPDTEAAKIGAQNGTCALAADGITVVVSPVPMPVDTVKNAIIAVAISAVGVQLNALTVLQQRALLACVLYKVGALDASLTVKSLNQWL